MSATPELMAASVKMIAGLVVVLGALLGAWYLMKRFMGSSGQTIQSHRIRVLASQCIGLKKHISLVQVPGAVLVLGVTNDRINCLASIPKADWPEDEPAPAGQGTVSAFMSQLKSEMSGLSRKTEGKGQTV